MPGTLCRGVWPAPALRRDGYSVRGSAATRPQLVSYAASHGYAVFFITGRPQSQTQATIQDLTSAGYAAPQPGHLFLKPSTPPPYLHCANPSSCTTIEYKSGTRAFIASQGYSIMADFGDQYSDLLGGDAGHQVKLPNPMYYIP